MEVRIIQSRVVDLTAVLYPCMGDA